MSGEDKRLQEHLKATGEIPRHIAIIMDGNGRWARHRGLPRVAGHREGVNSVRDIVDACGQLGVKCLTLYTFSTENWNRPKDEVSVLMKLLLKALRDERDRLHSNHVKLRTIGDTSRLPAETRKELNDAVNLMASNKGLMLVLALSYSGRWDITTAVQRIAAKAASGTLAPEDVSEQTIHEHLSTAEWADPDLLIRTSGEVRISNFLLWQLAYSEMYITQEFWPDFRRRSLYEAIAEFQKRERRYGKVSEQLTETKSTLKSYAKKSSKSTV